ncbi:MAG: hypothetical protein ABI950_00985 [Solirubrobacteraceae bacterium]
MSRLRLDELMGVVGGALLVLGVFLPWYETDPANKNAKLGELGRGVFSCWESHQIIRWLLLAAAVAPLILAYVIARDHKLSWARGEMTAVVAIIAFGLIVYTGIIQKPGSPPAGISLKYGYWVALLGSILIAVGSARRSSGTERPRKPPGVL